ncbi:MAG: hypothetical protein NTZ53_04945 [Cyanobacteria bacterium]|nr:hypothetical protein [Cyanobacteriota bacterium]
MARFRSVHLGALLLATGLLGPITAGRSQDLVGCQLVGASLQCVPGVTADPQQQIQIMRQEISNDIQQEGVVQQQINGLQQLVLNGKAEAGQLLVATAQFDAAIAVPQANYHWYRLAPGQRSWVLIETANGTTYVPASVDIGQQVMVVAVVNQNGTVKRVSSAAIGPIRAAAQ